MLIRREADSKMAVFSFLFKLEACYEEEMGTDAQTNQENKENCTEKTYYWVGKESLRLWSQLALKKLEAQLPFSKVADLDELTVNGDEPETDETRPDPSEAKGDLQAELLNDKSNSVADLEPSVRDR